MKLHFSFALLVPLLGACTSEPDVVNNSPATVLSASIIESGPLVRTLVLTLDKPASVEVEYWSSNEPIRRAKSAGSPSSDTLLLARLHAGRTYQYRVVGTTHQGTFSTDSLPADLAKIGFAATGAPTTPLALVHVFAYNGFRGYVIVDSAGEVVWYWRAVDFPFGMTRRANGNFVFMDVGRGLIEVTPTSSIVHELSRDTITREMHHDVITSPQNTLLFIAFDYREVDGKTVKGDAIWEWSPELGTSIRRWSSWDFLSVTDDRGPRFDTEWLHANALAIGPRGNVLLGIHYFNQIISIRPDWQSLEWRLGGVNATIPVENGQQFTGQHTAHEISPGRIIMFDNRHEQKGYSRAVEYEISEDTARKVWDWSATPTNFAAVVSSARRLPNGNTLVGFGVSQGIAGSTGPTEVYEVTNGGNTIWHLVATNVDVMYRAEPIESIAGEE